MNRNALRDLLPRLRAAWHRQRRPLGSPLPSLGRLALRGSSVMVVLLLLALTLAVQPGSLVADLDGDGLEEIGTFAIEDEGKSRGPWFQVYDGNGKRLVNFFLGDKLQQFQIHKMDLDGKGNDEIVVLAVDDEDRAVLQLRNSKGKPLGQQFVTEAPFTSLKLLAFDFDGDKAQEIAIGYSRKGDDSGWLEVWSFAGSTTRTRGATRPADLTRVAAFEIIPAGTAGHAWLAGDLSGDGTDEAFGGYTERSGNGAAFQVMDPESGAILGRRTAANDSFTGAQWVLGDFDPDREGREILSGTTRKKDGVGFMAVYDRTGKPLANGKATPAKSEQISWRALDAGFDFARDRERGDQVLVGYQERKRGWAYGVWDAARRKPRQVGGGAILDDTFAVEGWIPGNFDGFAANGAEVAATFTDLQDRSLGFQLWSRTGHTRLGQSRVLEGTYIELRALAIEAVSKGRQDLLIIARTVDGVPRLALWNANGPGTELMAKDVLSEDVE